MYIFYNLFLSFLINDELILYLNKTQINRSNDFVGREKLGKSFFFLCSVVQG